MGHSVVADCCCHDPTPRLATLAQRLSCQLCCAYRAPPGAIVPSTVFVLSPAPRVALTVADAALKGLRQSAGPWPVKLVTDPLQLLAIHPAKPGIVKADH